MSRLIILKPEVEEQLNDRFLEAIKDKIDVLDWHSPHTAEEFIVRAYIYGCILWVDLEKDDKHNVFVLNLRDGLLKDYDTNLTIKIWNDHESELYGKLEKIWKEIKEKRYQKSKEDVTNALEYLERYENEEIYL